VIDTDETPQDVMVDRVLAALRRHLEGAAA
jgi:hypothetical protein